MMDQIMEDEEAPIDISRDILDDSCDESMMILDDSEKHSDNLYLSIAGFGKW